VYSSHSNGSAPARRSRFVLRVLVVTCVALAAAAALVVVGRREERRAAQKELAGMQQVVAAVGTRLDSSKLSGYRLGTPDCLAYHGGEFLLEYQLCFDAQGRLVEAVDRRPLVPRYFSLEYKPSLSTIRFPRTEILGALQRAQKIAGY
jgi:hypothetical protein